ncbi:hypothetical protein [Pseudokordiimonas caeni]|uniref:hypothetical protein n=1 Tax=Pseudokordiimonas caeni TaxID=2997908 RepID=UPI0028127D00|nr:hypothetical protein [Pseudokordiimonas caeni]
MILRPLFTLLSSFSLAGVSTAAIMALAASVAVPVAGASAQASTCYSTFWPSGNRVVEIDTCDYNNGGSGYIVKANVSNRTIDLCWTLHFDDGSTEKGCHFALHPGEESASSCHRCSRKKSGGVVDVTFRKVEVVG